MRLMNGIFLRNKDRCMRGVEAVQTLTMLLPNGGTFTHATESQTETQMMVLRICSRTGRHRPRSIADAFVYTRMFVTFDAIAL